MIDIPTVFILGAGASKPYGYPTGNELKEFITSKLFTLLNRFIREREELQVVREACERNVREFVESFRGTVDSIDLFLSRRPEFMEVGKLAILYSIFHFEHKSRVDLTEGDWLAYLFRKMITTARKPNQLALNLNNVSFVSFNYDRSLEQFIYTKLINSFGEKIDSIIKEQISQIPILHVYGKVADLPWEESSGLTVDYNANPNQIDMWRSSDIVAKDFGGLQEHWQKQIFIIEDERAQNQQNIDAIKSIIEAAKRVFFLGFGFADENMGIIGFPDILRDGQEIRGTIMDITPHEFKQTAARFMPYLTDGRIRKNFLNGSCLDLLRNHL